MSNEKKIPRVIAIVGCTASGKSALALETCKRHNGELVSMDSMQIYRGMDIGTAKPTIEEQSEVVHHMIDVVDPCESYSSGAYVEAATKVICEISARGKLPVLCGGTGLYLDGLLRGGYGENYADPAVRAELENFADKEGAIALHKRLAQVDPESAAATHPNNVKRVIRALEIYLISGKTKTELTSSRRRPSLPSMRLCSASATITARCCTTASSVAWTKCLRGALSRRPSGFGGQAYSRPIPPQRARSGTRKFCLTSRGIAVLKRLRPSSKPRRAAMPKGR